MLLQWTLAASVIMVTLIRNDNCDCLIGFLIQTHTHTHALSHTHSVWEAVYYTQTEGSTVADVPHFFNISICGAISPGEQCSNSRVCYSDHMDTFYNLGTLNSCTYNYTNRTIQFTSDFSSDANFGQGNTTLTLICGRTLVNTM